MATELSSYRPAGNAWQALFELVRMHRIFSIYNTREEALAAL
ncbi:MAG: hypothetical protein Q8J99_10440 [Sulfuritalea sp.]|nr:hypothetical protein [Sulfuritalea sp.]